MINTSKEYKEKITQSDRVFLARAEITLSNGTVLQMETADIMGGGLQIESHTSSSGNFDIGYCAENKLIIRLINIDGRLDSYDFTGAIVVTYVGLQLSETVEYLKKGVFTVDTPEFNGGYVSLTCLDNMYLLDTNINALTGSTAQQVVNNICTACGVQLITQQFDGYDKSVTLPDNLSEITYRQLLGYICQITGNFAYFNADGDLVIKWYDTTVFEGEGRVDGGTFDNSTPYASGQNVDGGNFTNYNSGDRVDGGSFTNMSKYHHIYSMRSPSTIFTDDVVITGIRVKNDDTAAMYGIDGYVLDIVDNPLTVGRESEIANFLGAKIVGMRFRPMSISAISDPSREAGDCMLVTDRKMNTYQGYITGLTFTIGASDNITCDAQTPQANSSSGFSVITKAVQQARQAAKKQLTAYDIAVQQFNDLISHSFGVYKTEETLEDGSTVHYMHDKPTLAESQNIWKQTASTFSVSNDGGQTYVAGFDAQGNAVFNVLHAIGINADWINAGEINGIKITTQSGQIGPFVMSASGLTSKCMQFFDNGNYPLIWLTKPGESDGGPGTEGYARANYEPSVTRLSSVEDGVETVITLIARTAADTGIAGTIEIVKTDVSTGYLISEQIIRDGEMIYRTYESDGVNYSEYKYSASGIQASDGEHLIVANFDLGNGTLDIEADEINLIGDVYINGQLQ